MNDDELIAELAKLIDFAVEPHLSSKKNRKKWSILPADSKIDFFFEANFYLIANLGIGNVETLHLNFPLIYAMMNLEGELMNKGFRPHQREVIYANLVERYSYNLEGMKGEIENIKMSEGYGMSSAQRISEAASEVVRRSAKLTYEEWWKLNGAWKPGDPEEYRPF